MPETAYLIISMPTDDASEEEAKPSLDYISWANKIEGWLTDTFISIKGCLPDEGGFRPNDDTIHTALSLFSDERTLQCYCRDAVCAHLYRASHAKTHAPFFCNSRLFSKDLVAYVTENEHLIRQRFKSSLKHPSNFFVDVYSEIMETEFEYLMLASEYFYRDQPFNWSSLTPSVYWYLLVVSGVKEMTCNRMEGVEVPEHWLTVPVLYRDSYVEIEGAAAVERRRLKAIDVRNVFIRAAEKALYEMARKWAESIGLMRLYQDRNKRIAISPEFSQMSSSDIEICYPLENRDLQMFRRAKLELEAKGKTFDPIPDVTPAEPVEGDENFDPGTKGSTGIFSRRGSLENALAELDRNPDT